MILPPWDEVPVSKSHDRHAFDCGNPQLNGFLVRFARQSHEDYASKTYCLVERANPSRVLGYYTVTPAALKHESVPTEMKRGLARHEVPGFRLARLATDKSVAGKGLGAIMVACAARRCAAIAESGGGRLLIIDAKDNQAAEWYTRFGAVRIVGSELTLVMNLQSFVAELKQRGLL